MIYITLPLIYLLVSILDYKITKNFYDLMNIHILTDSLGGPRISRDQDVFTKILGSVN